MIMSSTFVCSHNNLGEGLARGDQSTAPGNTSNLYEIVLFALSCQDMTNPKELDALCPGESKRQREAMRRKLASGGGTHTHIGIICFIGIYMGLHIYTYIFI